MDWRTKVLIGGILVTVLAAMGVIIKYQYDIIQKQKEIETTILKKDLGNDVTRSETDFVTKKDLEAFDKSLDLKMKPIIDDLENLGAKNIGTNVIKVITTGTNTTNQGSTTTGNINPEPPKQPTDEFGYLKKEQLYKLNEKFSDGTLVPVGTVGFSAWSPKPWSENTVPRTYESVNVIGTDENGKHYNYSRFTILVDGKRYPVKIDDAKFVQELPSGGFKLNPRFYAGIDAGAYFTNVSGALTPNLELSLFSYGMTKTDSDWIFVNLGLGYEAFLKRFDFIFNPVSYNIGHHLPLVNNVFLGPSISVDNHGSFAIYMGLRFGL